MRSFFAAVLLAALLCSASLSAAEEGRTVLAGGAYSVAVPAGWDADTDTLRQRTTLSIREFPGCALVLSAPNPVLNASQGVALRLAALSKEGVTADIIAASQDVKDAAPRLVAQFAAPLDRKEALIGVFHVLTVDDCAVMMEASAPDSLFDIFAAVAVPVMESVRFDAAVIAENRAFYKALSEQLRDETVGRLATSGEKKQQLLDSLDALR